MSFCRECGTYISADNKGCVLCARRIKVPWHPDTVFCQGCHDIFTSFTRRHHCRNCGMCCCSNCSSKEFYITAYGKQERVCDWCYSVLKSARDLRMKKQSAVKIQSYWRGFRDRADISLKLMQVDHIICRKLGGRKVDPSNDIMQFSNTILIQIRDVLSTKEYPFGQHGSIYHVHDKKIIQIDYTFNSNDSAAAEDLAMADDSLRIPDWARINQSLRKSKTFGAYWMSKYMFYVYECKFITSTWITYCSGQLKPDTFNCNFSY